VFWVGRFFVLKKPHDNRTDIKWSKKAMKDFWYAGGVNRRCFLDISYGSMRWPRLDTTWERLLISGDIKARQDTLYLYLDKKNVYLPAADEIGDAMQNFFGNWKVFTWQTTSTRYGFRCAAAVSTSLFSSGAQRRRTASSWPYWASLSSHKMRKSLFLLDEAWHAHKSDLENIKLLRHDR